MNLLQLKAAESQLNPSFPKNKFSINVVADCGLKYKLNVKRFEIQDCLQWLNLFINGIKELENRLH